MSKKPFDREAFKKKAAAAGWTVSDDGKSISARPPKSDASNPYKPRETTKK